ncbi:hypothetical protein GGI07_002044 [Coemansia sp. Benny D115]|nr:hypothetical protein GGI07_002044 [Coemansia sp. Benny D115]
MRMQAQLTRRRINEIYSGPKNTRIDRSARTLADSLILLEHPPVYTNGRRNHGKVPEKEIQRLRSLGCDYVETNRGGELTFHGPGQLVVYPSLDLKDHVLGAKCFVEGLENTVIDACAQVGVKAWAERGFPGVWVSSTQKVAALGTHVQKYVTSHGLALNCTVDMQKGFANIVPCGLHGREAVSLNDLVDEKDVKVSDMVPRVLSSFSRVFGCPLVPLEELSPTTFALINKLLREAKQEDEEAGI